MNPWAERSAAAAAVLLSAVYLIVAAGIELPGSPGTDRVSGQASAYHGGKSVPSNDPDPVCQSAGCHDPFPHRKDRMESAFRNMHQGIADCLSCHGKDQENRWIVEPAGKGRRIRYDRETSAGEPHAALGQAIACRKCHSGPGLERFRGKGMTTLPASHADPIALRMIEGGPKRWAPADLR